MKRRRPWSLAALFALAFALFLRTAGAASAAPAAQPTLDAFVLGFGQVAQQLQNGRELDMLLSVSPGYLPVANRGAANGLRQMFADARFDYRQRGLGESCEQSLRIWTAGEPALSLTHRADGNRRLWTGPPWLSEGVETPMDLNLFAELLGQTALGEAVFPTPPASAESNAQQLLSLRRLLVATVGADFELTPEVANRALDAWRSDPVYGALLRPLISGWRVDAPAQVSYQLDDEERLASFRVSAQLTDPGGQVWNLDCKGSQGLEKRQCVYRLDATLTRSKINNLTLSATVTVSEQQKDQLRQAVKLTCEGRMDGHSVNLRLNGSATNRFSTEGNVLAEQIDGSYTLDWKAREPKLVNLGLDEWKVILGVKGTLRTPEARFSAAPSDATALTASLEGNLSLAMTRSRRDFLSGEITFRASTAEYHGGEAPQAAIVWERLGEEEERQLDDWRTLMRRQLAGKLMTGLDEETKDGIWMK